MVAIPGASTVAQLQRNAEAADLDLTAEDEHRLIDAAEAYRPLHGMAAVPSLVKMRSGETRAGTLAAPSRRREPGVLWTRS